MGMVILVIKHALDACTLDAAYWAGSSTFWELLVPSKVSMLLMVLHSAAHCCLLEECGKLLLSFIACSPVIIMPSWHHAWMVDSITACSCTPHLSVPARWSCHYVCTCEYAIGW